MILYSFSKEDLAWWNVIIVGSIALYFLFFAITQSREIIYSDKQGVVVPDRTKHICGIVMAVLISFIMISSTCITFYAPFKYSKILQKGEYYEVQGRPEKVESHILKTGDPDGFELFIDLEGVEFDTAFSYGESNKFNKDDFNCIKNGTINIKYIYEKTGTSLHPVILEMSLISNDKTEE